MNFLKMVSAEGASGLIVADDVDGEALATLVVNKLRGILRVAAVKSPGFGTGKKDMLEDLSALLGCSVLSEDKGDKIDDLKPEHIGRCARVVINKDSTTFVDGKGNEEEISNRIKRLQKQIADETSDYNREKLQLRLAKLSGGVAVIKIGASTEVEMKEKKDRIDDALHATKAAVEEGIVPGGGVAYVRCIEKLNNLDTGNADQNLGVRIVQNALKYPLQQIAKNAGVSHEIVLAKVLEGSADGIENYGYNARTDEYGDMLAMGVIDPTKVTRVALENAASVSGLLLTTETTVTINKDDKDNDQGGGINQQMM